VFYMGRDTAPQIAAELIEAGRDGATAVAIVEACSTPRERCFATTLAAVAAGDAYGWLDPAQPSVLLIGDAFADRGRLVPVGAAQKQNQATQSDDGQRVA
jgi:uroporphyrin-III C-methyltransferase